MKKIAMFITAFLTGMSGTYMIMGNSSSANEITINLKIPPETKILFKQLDQQQVKCMAENIYFEARGESKLGKEMVAQVVMNRTKSPHYPNTVCGVVHQVNFKPNGELVKNSCQFSWYCEDKDLVIDLNNPIDRKSWEDANSIAKKVMLEKVKLPVDINGMTSYHSRKIRPFWAKSHHYRMIARVGHHLFYQWDNADKLIAYSN